MNQEEKAFYKRFGQNGERATSRDWADYHNAVMPALAFPGAPMAKDKPIGWVGPECWVNHHRSLHG